MTVDPDKLKLYSFQLFTKLEGAVTSGMVHLGDQLGLYAAMKSAAPLTTGNWPNCRLDERWVREWAYNQAAAKLIEVDEQERFSLSAEAAAVLATPDHPAFGMGMFHRLPELMQSLVRVRDSFVTGLGHDYDSHGAEGAVGIERSFEPWSNAFLIPTVLPALDDVVDRLTTGASVVDIGCGAGSAVLLMAAAFPKSTFVGYDISHFALARAIEKQRAAGVTNATFCDPRDSPPPMDHSIDVVTTFDCLHDMTHPQQMMERDPLGHRRGRHLAAGRHQGARHVRTERAKNPMASLMYGISVLSCMSSALSEPDGAGLGTLGLSATKAREMAEHAGFTRFRKLDVDHSVNAFYEVRP
jgi:SAM-dependent methyltransferase